MSIKRDPPNRAIIASPVDCSRTDARTLIVLERQSGDGLQIVSRLALDAHPDVSAESRFTRDRSNHPNSPSSMRRSAPSSCLTSVVRRPRQARVAQFKRRVPSLQEARSFSIMGYSVLPSLQAFDPGVRIAGFTACLVADLPISSLLPVLKLFISLPDHFMNIRFVSPAMVFVGHIPPKENSLPSIISPSALSIPVRITKQGAISPPLFTPHVLLVAV